MASSQCTRSRQFRTLASRLSQLRRELLPTAFAPTGRYSAAVVTRTIAYRLLAHAEIEEFLESRAQQVATNAVRRFESTYKVSLVVPCLLAFSGLKYEKPPESLAPQHGKSAKDWNRQIDVVEKLNHSLKTYISSVMTNHGIREKNILALMLPIGIHRTQFDSAWLATMDSFGQNRGLVAHRSLSVYRASHVPDPKSELDTVNEICIGLLKLDNALAGLNI